MKKPRCLPSSVVAHNHLPLTVYGPAWDEFSAALPWFEDDPAGARILALHSLMEFPTPWEAEFRDALDCVTASTHDQGTSR